jgi:hypothetical protein
MGCASSRLVRVEKHLRTHARQANQAHERIGTARADFRRPTVRDGYFETARAASRANTAMRRTPERGPEAQGSHGRTGTKETVRNGLPAGNKQTQEPRRDVRDRLSPLQWVTLKRSASEAQPIPRRNHRGDARETAGGSTGSDDDPKPGGQEQHCVGPQSEPHERRRDAIGNRPHPAGPRARHG